MAIEFLMAKMITRGQCKRGIPAHMAYRECTKIYDERAERTFDYSNKNSVLDSFLVNAGGNTLEELANKMEAAEKRKDAQVAREFILALPHELSLETNRSICEEFAGVMARKYGISAHVAIHKPDELRDYETHRSDDSLKNIHAHITISTRAIDEGGGFSGKKLREMNDRKYLEGLKHQVRKIINNELKNAGYAPMETRDPKQEGTRHLGPELTRLERRGGTSAKGEINRNIERNNTLRGKIRKIDQEIEVLREGNITIDGMTFKNVPYPKGRNFKPYLLAGMDPRELMKEMRYGKLRVKERYDENLIRSFSYKGQDVTVAELALINPMFPNKEVAFLERKLRKCAIRKELHKGLNSEHDRRKKAVVSLSRVKAYIPQISTISKENEAHGHAKQAAWAIEHNRAEN